MPTNAFLNALIPLPGAPASRAARLIGRADVFNRFYIAAMFSVILAIGGFGMYTLRLGAESDVTVAARFDQANEVNSMGTALDKEEAEVVAQMSQRQGIESTGLVRAAEAFDAANARAQRAGSAINDPVLMSLNLNPRQERFVADSRAIAGALAGNDYAKAVRIETTSMRPNVGAMRAALDAMAVGLFHASVADQAADRMLMSRMFDLILAVTILGVVLMAGFAVLLGRYKQSAYRSAGKMMLALEQAATTDNLTQLGNNRSFYEDFEREIARAKRHNHSLVLALLDVDDFKAVNDKGGHSYGDTVLARVGTQLRNTRKEDRAYRIGGDEFALILVETDPEGAGLAIGRLQSEIREANLGATVSIGYVNLSGEQLDMESYELADTALYEAKRLGRNQTVCFKNISANANVYSPRKADAVRRMIAQGLLTTAFQPIWDMQSTRPLGFEALARPHVELELSGPQEAFDIAQRIRQLPALDMICTQKALAAAGNLPAGSTIFINYSPVSLTHSDFAPATFVDTVRAAGFLPEQIVIELTERRIDDPTSVAARAAELRALGFRIALDDTGSGHAGLEILSKVRFDFVKIDRNLIIEAMKNREARSVLAGIIAIARETHSYLIAEGIETDEMLEFVRSVHTPQAGHVTGVRGIQGYLVGRPEVGSIDLHSLQEHSNILAACQLERRVPSVAGTVLPFERRAAEVTAGRGTT